MRLAMGSALVAVALLLPAHGEAQTLYKLIDKNGKITYVEKVPKDFDGKVIRVDIDPNRNRMDAPKPAATDSGEARKQFPGEEFVRKQEKSRQQSEDRVAQAKSRLEAARKAFEEARDNPEEGDLLRFGKVGGGSRVEPTPEYARRLEQLEASVKEAEEALRRAERGEKEVRKDQ